MKKGIVSFGKRLISCGLKLFGSFALVMIILAFTDIPYYAYHNLSLSDQQLESPADAIVIMGGDGMPSPQGLMRSYFGAKAAKMNPQAKVIIAMPYNEEDSTWQLRLMAHDLVQKGIDTNRILFEPNGFNTRSQALEVAELIPLKSNLLIVSSPDHLYRSIRCFEKVGFANVGSLPTFEVPSDEEKLKDKTNKKDKRVRNLSLRYNLWSYLQYEIKVLREYVAISYYWIKGWI